MKTLKESTLASVTPDSPTPPLGSIPQPGEIDIHETLSVKVRETKDPNKKQMVVKLIETGLSKNGYYYSKDVAESVADLIQSRPQMYMDHSMDFFGGGARSFNELVAVATESYKKDGAAYAIVEVVDNPATSWLYELAKNHDGLVGASIDARARIREAEKKDGILWGEENFDPEKSTRQKFVVEELAFLNSVDFVTYPSAGGQVVELMASQITDEATKKLSQLMEGFKHEMTNLITKETEESNMANSEVTLTKESFRVDYPDLFEQIREEVVADAESNSAVEAKISTLEKSKEDLEKKLEEASEANDELRIKLDEFEIKEKIVAKSKMVKGLIEEHELADNYISEVFIEDLMKLEDEEAIVSRIKDRKSLVETQAGEVTGNGQRQAKESTEVEEDPIPGEITEDDLIKSIKQQHANPNQEINYG